MVMFGTPDELRIRTQLTLDELPQATAEQALTLASALVQNETRQHLALVTDDEVTLGPAPGPYLTLPERPVIDVTAVAVLYDWGNPTSPTVLPDDTWRLSADALHLDLYHVDGWGGFALVTVTYSHGYDPIPDDLRAVVLAVAGRAVTNPDGARQETLGSYSRTLSGDTDSLASGLAPHERAACWRYRRRTHGQVR